MPHFDPSNYLPLLLRLGLAFLLGGAVGFEREMRGQPAGLRTHILVCLGSALIAMVDVLNPMVQGKIAAQIVTGVGFLGAGTILRTDRGVPVHGLTTAASIWCTSGIGIALGYGGISIWMGISVAMILLITLTAIGAMEGFLLAKQSSRVIDIYLTSPNPDVALTSASTLVDSFSAAGIKIESLRTEQTDPHALIKVLHVRVQIETPSDTDKITKLLSENPLVSQFDWAKSSGLV